MLEELGDGCIILLACRSGSVPAGGSEVIEVERFGECSFGSLWVGFGQFVVKVVEEEASQDGFDYAT